MPEKLIGVVGHCFISAISDAAMLVRRIGFLLWPFFYVVKGKSGSLIELIVVVICQIWDKNTIAKFSAVWCTGSTF